MTDNLAVSDERVNKCGYVVVSNASGQIVPDFHSFDYGDALLYSLLEVPGSTVKPWMEAHVEELTRKGYHLTPAYFINGERTNSVIKDGQTYPLGHKNWSYATEIVSVVPKDCVMIDWDGDKPDAATVEDVATALGLTVEELDKARIQHRRKGEKASIHWLFRLPENTPVKTCTSEWLSRVDLRANTDHPQGSKNGFIDIKPGKIINLPHVDKIVKLDLSCVAVPFPKRAENVDRTQIPMPTGANVEEVRDALNFIDPDCEYDDWKSVGMALQAEFGDSGLSLWDEWSSKGAKYPGTRHLSDKYRTFKPKAGGVSVKTLFKMARDGGWNSRKVIDAAMVFGAPTLPAAVREGFQLIAGSNLVDFFKGCVYIIQQHRMMTPNGALLRPEQFNAAYGGFVFALDSDSDKTTRKAFEAFTESQFASLPKVDSLAFRPELPPGEVFTEAGLNYVNCYVPTHGKRAEGDITPFLNHMQKLIPDEGDRKILLTWIASCIQNPGKKHQWSPVLVGAEGNGKSLVAKIVKHALGKRWVAEPRPEQIGGRFNSWIENKLFAVIEEIHMNSRRETLDAMKPIITNTTVEVEGKGRDSYDAENRCNILMCTNYKDAVIKTRDDRRYAIIYTGQHSEEEIKRDGMGGDYFTKLYDWLKHGGGYAAVADWFDKYNDVSCDVMGRAPRTSSTDAAIIESLGGAEQDIIEAVELEKVGFRSGLISLSALDHLMIEKGHRLQTKRKAKILTEMGYIRHPNLPDGKLKIQGSYVRVYVKKGHPMESAGVDVIRERLTSIVDPDPAEVFGAAK